MKAAVVLFFVVAAAMAGTLQPRACAGNNCKRQVTGTRAGLLDITSRQEDCSSFMKATVVPEAATTTVTTTITVDDLYDPAKFKRDIRGRGITEVPSAIPAYASSCTSAVDYSAACSCWGITAVTTTAERPTVTSTVTVTVSQEWCDDDL